MCIPGSGMACNNAPRCERRGPPRRWCTEMVGSVIEEPSLASALLRDVPNGSVFLENAASRHLGCVGRGLVTSSADPLRPRAEGLGTFCPLRPLVLPTPQCLESSHACLSTCVPVCSWRLCPLDSHSGLQACEVCNSCSHLGNSVQGVCPGEAAGDKCQSPAGLRVLT